jgi:predicted nucleotide-binding protein
MDNKTKELIRQRLQEFQELGRPSVRPSVLEYRDWADRAFSLMNYGKRISWSREIADIHKYLSGFVGETDNEGFRVAKNAAARIYDYLEEELVSFENSSDHNPTKTSQAAQTLPVTPPLNRKVFVVHGHDEAKKLELKNFLTDLQLEPIVLHLQDDLGKTIIEKFEHYAMQCAFAFVLLTPDDAILEADPEQRAWRSRQNVIMELGWFMARLGRERVIILQKGNVELPSDILGVLYLPFRKDVAEASEKIRQRLKGSGLIA